MENKFFTLIRPYLKYIDSGALYKQPFRILYQVIAVLMLLFPLGVSVRFIGYFRFASVRTVFGLILVGLVLIAAGWFSFQLWWNRATQLKETSTEGDDFVATPVLSNLVQTFGEWFGSYTAGVGFVVTLLSLIFLDGNMNFIPGMGWGFGWLGLILFPVYGFVVVIVCRWVAETMRALVAIANNTRK